MHTETNARTDARQRPSQSKVTRIEALRPGESVVIGLRGRASDRVDAWAGVVLAVDATAVRVAAGGSRLCLSWGSAAGERVIPRTRVKNVKVAPSGR